MADSNRVIVVMPAYNAEKTLRRTYNEVPHEIVDEIVLVDDASQDHTAAAAAAVDGQGEAHELNSSQLERRLSKGRQPGGSGVS